MDNKATTSSRLTVAFRRRRVDTTHPDARAALARAEGARRRGRYGTMDPLVSPENSDARFGTILVHPIPDDTDSQLEGLPGDDMTAKDCILVFPAESGLRSMYVVYARPFNGDHGYHPPPKELTAFPEAKVAPRRT